MCVYICVCVCVLVSCTHSKVQRQSLWLQGQAWIHHFDLRVKLCPPHHLHIYNIYSIFLYFYINLYNIYVHCILLYDVFILRKQWNPTFRNLRPWFMASLSLCVFYYIYIYIYRALIYYLAIFRTCCRAPKV